MRGALGRFAACLLVAVATLALPGVSVAPASAAACSDAGGITVVVDFKGLGGGEKVACVRGGSAYARTLFTTADFSLTDVQRQPGFVCRISGKPADDPCVDTPPANAYWGLFWSNGTSGSWNYSSSGAGGLKVPAGGSVAFAWQGSDARSVPSSAPPKHDPPISVPPPKPPKPTPSTQPTTPAPAAPTTESSGVAPSASPTASATPSPSASPRAESTVTYGAAPVAMPQSTAPDPAGGVTASASAEVEPEIEPTASDATDGGGLPLWVPLSVIALGLAGAGTAYYLRRRNG